MKRTFDTITTSKEDTENQGEIFKRRIPHVDGNWPSFVYIPVSICSTRSKNLLNVTTSHFTNKFDYGDKFVKDNNLHISLSKPFYLRYHQIESFIKQLSDSLHQQKRFQQNVESCYYILSNEDQSRYFLSLPLNDHSLQLKQLISKVDNTLKRYNKSIYYDNPKYHISILSMITCPIIKNNNNTYNDQSISDNSTSLLSKYTDNIKIRSHNNINIAKSKDDDNVTYDDSNTPIYTIPKNYPITSSIFSMSQSNSVKGDKNNSDHSDEEDDDDDDDDTYIRPSQQQAISLLPLSCIIDINCIECIIGNRLFRYNLHFMDIHETHNSQDIHNQKIGCFYEVQ